MVPALHSRTRRHDPSRSRHRRRARPQEARPQDARRQGALVQNALKHGLRARSFGILPEEDQAEWAEHVRDLRQGYGPVDAAEEKLVTAIAVAMWNEIRADRTLVETMAEIPPCRSGRSHGSDLQEPENARSLGTALRYMTAAGMATQRAQRAFLAHRKAKQTGLILPAAQPAEAPANQNCTNECMVRPRSARLVRLWPGRVGVNVSGLLG